MIMMASMIAFSDLSMVQYFKWSKLSLSELTSLSQQEQQQQQLGDIAPQVKREREKDRGSVISRRNL